MEQENTIARDFAANPVTVQDLLDAGLHFGHQIKRWNPKMTPYIFDKRNGIHIIDLNKSLYLLEKAAAFVEQQAESGRNMLLVGTKKQAQSIIKEVAEAAKLPYVSHRWMGGMLTNADTIRQRVARLKELDGLETSGQLASMHKKEASVLRHELNKLRRNLTGIAEMRKPPAIMFVIDAPREDIAVLEANKLGIPVVAMVDTNANPDLIDYPIPGNDDAIRAIELVTRRIAAAYQAGHNRWEEAEAERARKKAEEEKRIEEARRKAAEEAKKAKKAAEQAAKEAKEAKAKAAEEEAAAKAKAAEEAKAAEVTEAPAKSPEAVAEVPVAEVPATAEPAADAAAAPEAN